MTTETLADNNGYIPSLDHNGQWRQELCDLALERSGYVVNIGQIPDWMKRQLDRRAKAGDLVKYRGNWDDPLGHRGFGLMIKTIWARRDVAPAYAIAA